MRRYALPNLEEKNEMKGKRVLLTGGAGDLGQRLCPRLLGLGASICSLDPVEFDLPGIKSMRGSVLDRDVVSRCVIGQNIVVHIAAWHGFHEFTGSKSPQEFWDLNMTGTFNVLQSCAESGVEKVVFISSTSVDEWPGVYGTSKVLGEELCKAYAKRHGMQILALRPRAFIPWTNKAVYQTFREWADWFARGAVHIDDVVAGTEAACATLLRSSGELFDWCELDGKHTFVTEELATWHEIGGVRFLQQRFPEFAEVMQAKSFFPEAPPSYKELERAVALIGYSPQYGFEELLSELRQFG